MASEAQRCEPPEEHRNRDDMHYVQRGTDKPRLCEWVHGWGWNAEWMFHGPETAAQAGWRYIAPVPDPAELAALIRQARQVERLLRTYAAHHYAKTPPDIEKAERNVREADALTTALAAPSIKGITNDT